MNVQQPGPKSVLLSLTSQFLLPDSDKDLVLLDPCDCLGCLGFSDPNTRILIFCFTISI